MMILKCFGVGLAFGALFQLLGFPIPAPPSLAGVAGVVGVTLGYLIVKGFVL